MSGFFALLLEASLRIGAVAAIVGVILLAARVRAGSVRHAAWAAVLCAMLLMPALPYFVPRVPLPAGPVGAIPMPDLAAEPAPSLPSIPPERPLEAARSVMAANAPVGPVTATVAAPRRSLDWPLVALAVYLAGALGLLARLLLGWRAAQGIAREIRLAPGVSRQGPVYESRAMATPLTIGTLAPKVVLPAGWREWSGPKLRAVLAHEFAHVRRRDPVFSLLARVNTCIFWFHPLAWWLRRELAASAEQACDDEGVRAAGESRRYAEILVELADTVRRAGGRYSWQGIGMDGAGLLGERIDRILQGGPARKVSGGRKAMIGAGCAAAIFLAAACGRPGAVAPLRDNPGAASEVKVRAEEDFRNAAARMTADQAKEVEAAVAKNPEDMEARRRLLIFYWQSGAQKIGAEQTIQARRRQILWLIEHHPGSDLAGIREAWIFPAAVDPLPDPEGYAEAKKLWLAQAERKDAPIPVLSNAAWFFRASDKPLTETMLLRARALGGKSYSGELGRLYAEVLVGGYGSMPMGVVRATSMAEAHSAYANEVRRKLAQSTDGRLLVSASQYLVTSRNYLYKGNHVDFDPLPLAKSYLERALQLDPSLPAAHGSLVNLRRLDGSGPIPAGFRQQPREVQLAAVRRLPEAARFAALGAMAPMEYLNGDGADYYRHDTVNARAGWESARKYATEALQLAPRVRNSPDYGTAFYNANMTLGMLAMRDGNRKLAVRYLLEASQAPPTEELAYSMQPLGFKLPAWLLKDGERQTVIEYLERFAKVDIAQSYYLRQSAALIREGKKPLWFH